MDQKDRGHLSLKAVPGGKANDPIIGYLSKLTKGSSHEKIAALMNRLPVILSNNVSAATAGKVVAQLQKLGATALFRPVSPRPETYKSRPVRKEGTLDLMKPVTEALQTAMKSALWAPKSLNPLRVASPRSRWRMTYR